MSDGNHTRWTAFNALASPRASWELLRLRRSLLRRDTLESSEVPAMWMDGLDIEKHSRADVASAFQRRDLEAMNAYDRHSSVTTGTRLITVALLAYRGLPDALKNNGLTSEHIDIVAKVDKALLEYAEPPRSGNLDTLVSLLRAVFMYPERTSDILVLGMGRGMPNGDITPIVEAMMTGSVLAEGAL